MIFLVKLKKTGEIGNCGKTSCTRSRIKRLGMFFQYFWMFIYTVYIYIVLYCYCNFLNHILTYRLTITYNTTTLKTLHIMASTLSSTRQNNVCFPLEISLPITCQISPRDCGVHSKWHRNWRLFTSLTTCCKLLEIKIDSSVLCHDMPWFPDCFVSKVTPNPLSTRQGCDDPHALEREEGSGRWLMDYPGEIDGNCGLFIITMGKMSHFTFRAYYHIILSP